MDILHAAHAGDSDISPFLKAQQERTRELASEETTAAALGELWDRLVDGLIKYGRIDGQLYYLECKAGRKPNGKWTVGFVIHQIRAQTRTVKTEGGPRQAFRCGQPFRKAGIDWVEWSPSVLALEGEQPRYPVYVQSHALDDLYRKEARALFIEDGEWLVHDYLWQSLRAPKITPMSRAPGKFLVEYHLMGHKLGYLVAHALDGMVLVESFLFLTMDGTPEGDALWKKLRLRRSDKKHLELDKIHTFLLTDVQFDPELVAILEECGFGHLFRVMKEPPRDRFVAGYAKDLRTYLRLEV